MRRATFSRNYTLSLSRTCRCHCKYCAFATHRAHIHPPDEVERRLEEAARRSAKELLVLTGERPEVNSEVAARLAGWGHDDFTSYVAWACERALERGILPHTNIGVLGRDDLARLREVTASQGLMLESVSERLMETVHAGSPTKHPARRLATIEAAGELRIPFTSGILVGIGESEEERIASLEALAALHARYGHIQEIILQNFVPHPRYYGHEVADIADHAARDEVGRRGSGVPSSGSGMAGTRPAPSAKGTAGSPRRKPSAPQVAGTEALTLPRFPSEALLPPAVTSMADTRLGDARLDRGHEALDPGVQATDAGRRDSGAAQSVGLVGGAGRGGCDGPGGVVGQRRSHLPRARLSQPAPGPQTAGAAGLRADRAALRLPAVHGPRVDGAGGPRRGQAQVLELHPPPRLGAQARGVAAARLTGRAIAKGREGAELSEDELTALFAETRPEAIEEMRAAADELRAELAGERATFVVNRNINFTNICVVGCAFCGFGQGRRSPDAYEVSERDFAERVREAVEFGATEICMQGGSTRT